MTEARNDYPESLEAASTALQGMAEEDYASGRVERLLGAAAEIGESDGSRIAGFVRDHLLPLCLLEPPANDQLTAVRGHRLRKLLVSWLNSLPDETLWQVRNGVLEDVITELARKPTFAGLYCLAGVGYRSAAAVNALRIVAGPGGKLGHEALRLLVGMEPSEQDRAWIAQQIEATSPGERTDELLNAAAWLHDARWLPMLTESAAKAENPLFAFSRIAWLGENAPGDATLQDRIWSAVLEALEARAERFSALFATNGVVRRCHSERVLAWLGAQLPEIHASMSVHPIRWAERSQEATSLVQLSGWRAVDPGDVARVFVPLLEANSGSESVGMTADGHAKEVALDTLLCCRSRDVFDMAEGALRNEGNPYMSAQVMNRFAVLALPVLPDSATSFLASFHGGDRKSQNNAQLVAFLAASRLVSSSLSLDALDLMIRSQGTVDGHPYSAPVEAAAEQAIWLARAKAPDVIPRLLRAADMESPVAQGIAVRALAVIVGSPLDDETRHSIDVLLQRVASDTSRQPYIRLPALQAVAQARAQSNRPKEIDALLSTVGSEEDLRGSVVSAVVASGSLEPYRELIDKTVTVGTERAAYIAGQLAAAEPHRYADRAADLIGSERDNIAEAVLSGHLANEQKPLPTSMTDALVARIRAGETGTNANPPLLSDMSVLAPKRFIVERWEQVWHEWMPTSRETIATAVPVAVERAPDVRLRAIDLLLSLMTDGVFAVRRAAARALSKIEIERLSLWCAEAIESGSIELRKMGAEAAGWLPIDSATTMDNQLLRVTSADPERVIREASERSRDDLRKRLWSRNLFAEIRASRADPNDWVLQTYPLGRALAAIGDDDDLQQLESMSRDRSVPPNVRYWLGLVARDLEKQWKKTTDQWPQSSNPWRHARERFDEGVVTFGGTKHPASVALWRRRRQTPDHRGSWGGAATLTSDDLPAMFVSTTESATLDLPGRPSAGIAVVESTLVMGREPRFVFLGNGPYPDRQNDDGRPRPSGASS